MQQLVASAVLGFELQSLVLEVVDLAPEAIALQPRIVVLGPEASEVVVHYNYKDSSTQDVAKAHMCRH